MEKVKTHYSCQQCGYQSPKWLGRCPGCGEWNTLSEEAASTGEHSLLPSDVSAGEGRPQRIVVIDTRQEGRVGTGIGEFDRVLGGGVVVGSVVLIGVDPGVGKSTLPQQVWTVVQWIATHYIESSHEKLSQLLLKSSVR